MSVGEKVELNKGSEAITVWHVLFEPFSLVNKPRVGCVSFYSLLIVF